MFQENKQAAHIPFLAVNLCVCVRACVCIDTHTNYTLLQQKPDVAKEMETDILRSDFITCWQLTNICIAEQRHTILQVQSISEVKADREEAYIQNLFPHQQENCEYEDQRRAWKFTVCSQSVVSQYISHVLSSTLLRDQVKGKIFLELHTGSHQSQSTELWDRSPSSY
jgi:hypothetical protein